MKKFFSLLAVLTLVGMVSSSVFAASTGTSYGVKTAKVTFTGDALSFDVKLYTYVKDKDFTTYTGDGVDEIGFSIPDGFVFGQEAAQPITGTTIAKVSTNLRLQPAGTTIYLYTDNVHATGDFKANAAQVWDNKSYYHGLIRKGNTTTYELGDHASIELIIRSVTEANSEYKSALPDFSVEHFYTQGHRGLQDISDDGFGSLGAQEKVIGISGTNGGIWHYNNNGAAGTDDYTGTEDAIIFFGAQVQNVLSGDQFGTSTITFATITE